MDAIDDATLQRIIQEIVGPLPGLYVPRLPKAVKHKVGARFIIAPSRRELPGGSPPVGEFLDALLRVPMPNGVIGLAAVNFVVSKISYLDPMHWELSRHFLTEDRFQQLRDFIARNPPQPDAIHLFNRVSVLLLQRLIMAVSSLGSGTDRESGHLLGELALMANDYVTGSALRRAERQHSVDYLTLLVEMLPTWDVTNGPDLAYGLTRAYRLLQVHLLSDDPIVTDFRQRLPLDFSKATFDGLRLDEYVACIFGMYSLLESLNVYDVIAGRQSCVIDTTAFLGTTHFPQDSLDRFVAARSRTIEQFRDLVSAERLDTDVGLDAALGSDAFIADTIPFRAYPLCRLDETHVACLDKQFLSELLIFGLYWRVLEALGNADGDLFLSLWGRLFELHMNEQLRFHYPSDMSPLKTDVPFPPDGQVDALLEFGDDVVLFEFKGSLLKVAAKHNRDAAAFQKEFWLKFVENEKGDPKAIRQLATSSAAAIGGLLPLTIAPKRIFPVLVGYETCLDAFWVNRYANDLFRPYLHGDLAPLVRPLTTMSVEAFEQAIAYTSAGDISWPGLLDRRFFGDNQVVDYSVAQAIYDWRAEKGRAVRRNELILSEFARIFDRVMAKYRESPGEQAAPKAYPDDTDE